eukprot:TRINITY_DN3998_c0_g1_i1.p1 TRINITY_DN3998_c0_g1~~TRINITY_DN3998_c0_g1_i1.p1  ORF type:complete len:357 (-),score=96.24 TRINITY_DN3998_c0_g1_i1:41-1111(-)
MLCCDEGEGSRTNRAINKLLRREKRVYDSQIKLLLLGAGESGKSTIAKQMKILHKEGFDEIERNQYKIVVYNNIMQSMLYLLSYDFKKQPIQLSSSVLNETAERLIRLAGDNFYAEETIHKSTAEDIKALLDDPIIHSRRSNCDNIYVCSGFLDDIDRIAGEKYTPTDQDILKARAKTTGIVEISFTMDDVMFKIVDVGGQRCQRRKWINCFEDVSAVVFCAALNEYDVGLYEDPTINRMTESITIFNNISNTEWLRESAMILFLNKDDLFREKIKRVPLSEYFSEFTTKADLGSQEYYEAAIDYIKQKFITQCTSPARQIYTHITCATDTDRVRVVFKVVKDVILRRALDSAGIL